MFKITILLAALALIPVAYFSMGTKTAEAVPQVTYTLSANSCSYYVKPATCLSNGCCWTGSCAPCK